MARSRLARLRGALRSKGLDALLVTSLPNIRFLSGFTGSNALCVVRGDKAVLVTDSRYAQQSRLEVRGLHRVITGGSLIDAAAERRLLQRCRRVGFEAHFVTYAQYRLFRRAFPDVEFRSTAELVEEVALVKEPVEIRSIRRAAAISDRVFHEVLPLLRVGVSELEVSAHISLLHRRFGAERDAFEPIVASGERGALPHARATARRFRKGEFVTLDFGCVVDGYNSDLTRTVAIGRPSRRLRDAYEVVRISQQAAVDAARPGMEARELDAIARRSIEESGLGKYFTHSLGHGIGLRIHERPRVSWVNPEKLLAGSVITIEPGVYVPGAFGVRIEDDVLLTPRGCTVLTTAPKDLIVLPL